MSHANKPTYDQYLDDQSAGDWHTPYQKYCAGYRKGRESVLAQVIHSLGIPEEGSALDGEWRAAMGDPECVPGFVAACILEAGNREHDAALAELRAGGVELPSHPEQYKFTWSNLELRLIQDYGDRRVAAAVQRWIATSERMPEEGTECLVVTKYGVSIDTWQEQHEAPLSFSSATIPIGVMWDDHEFEDVSHWMPLPQPPETKP